MQFGSFISGVCLGAVGAGAAAVASQGGYGALDRDVSLAHSRQFNEELKSESDLLRLMALDNWVGLDAAEAQSKLKELGIFDFDKSADDADNLLVAGFPEGPGQVSLALHDGRVAEIRNWCWSFHSEGCAQGGAE